MNRILYKIKKHGILRTCQLIAQKIIGISSHDEEINSLYYFLNNYVDITKLPPTKDIGLRNLQKCDAQLLKIFDRICEKYNLTYWLDYGTLLGAVRHNGFIPWDDDTDVSMPRKDYNKLLNLKDFFIQKGLNFSTETPGRIGIAYMHERTGIWIDVFPVDELKTDDKFENIIDALKIQMNKFRKQYCKLYQSDNYEEIEYIRESFLKNYQIGHNLFYISSLEFSNGWLGLTIDDIYPLQKLTFENITLNVPNKLDSYLNTLYGNYMSFPHRGIEQHGEAEGRAPLGTWASINNIDMNDIYKELTEIYNII